MKKISELDLPMIDHNDIYSMVVLKADSLFGVYELLLSRSQGKLLHIAFHERPKSFEVSHHNLKGEHSGGTIAVSDNKAYLMCDISNNEAGGHKIHIISL